MITWPQEKTGKHQKHKEHKGIGTENQLNRNPPISRRTKFQQKYVLIVTNNLS